MEYMRNMTDESILIGSFDKPRRFNFCVLQFKNISDIVEQGKIVEYFLHSHNFLLLPRNVIVRNTTEDGENYTHKYYTSLLILWDDGIDVTFGVPNMNEIEWSSGLRKMLEQEQSVFLQSSVFLNNGKTTWKPGTRCSNISDNDGQYSYLITHRYINNEFVYRITSTYSFKKHFSLLKNHGLDENTILDLVFTGRDQNEFHNCYHFGGYKVKDSFIDESTDRVILSNVKGVIDLERCYSQSNYVTFIDLLPDWNSPIVNYNYYSGMSIRMIRLIPENKVEFRNNNVYYKNYMLGDRAQGILDVVLAQDEELRYSLIKTAFRSGPRTSIEEFMSSKDTVEAVIERFDRGRIEQEKLNVIRQREDVLGTISQARREIQNANEQITLLEYRTREFIPFPDIVLPNREDVAQVYDVMSLLKERNGKYIIEDRGE